MAEDVPDLSIIIVSWNSSKLLHQCLVSIETNAEALRLEILVIDNHSSDGTVEMLRRDHPGVQLVALPANVGFPKASNRGFAMARGRYLLALNPDTVVNERTLQRSIEFLEQHQGYGCVGVKTLKPNGRVQLACARQFITLRRAIFGTLMLDKVFHRSVWMSSPDMAFWDHDNDRDVDMVQGAYMMLPAEVYRRLGGFDETLPMFLEDNELCVRIWQNGYKIRYLSTVSILHHVGASTRKAQAKWISELRYESYRRVIERSQGARMAKTYVLILPFVLMIKLGLLPFLCLGMYLRNGVCYFAQHLFETLHGFSWVWQKLTAPEKDYYSTSSPFSNVDARETDHPT